MCVYIMTLTNCQFNWKRKRINGKLKKINEGSAKIIEGLNSIKLTPSLMRYNNNNNIQMQL